MSLSKMPHSENPYLSTVNNSKFSLNMSYFPCLSHFTDTLSEISNLANQFITYFHIKLLLPLLLVTSVFYYYLSNNKILLPSYKKALSNFIPHDVSNT